MLQTKYFSLYVFHKPLARFTTDRNGVISVSICLKYPVATDCLATLQVFPQLPRKLNSN